MRCRRCQKEISGIGKPAVPPVLPAVIALVGVIYGLWSLTLGQDPANALPHWSPVTGWGASLAALVLAAVLVWIGLVRRRCPECGSTQMYDAMEEEGLIASERLTLQKAAGDQKAIEPGTSAPGESGRDLRAAIEAELRSAQAKEMADRLAAQEKELRAALGAEQERHSAESERVLRKRLEEELRPQIEAKLRSEIERQLRPVTPPPITTAKAIGSSVAPVATARPVTPPPTTAAKAIASTARPVTPPPTTTAKAIASSVAPPATTPTPVMHSLPRLGTPAPGAVMKTAQPATSHAKVETAPLSLLSSRAAVRLPASAASAHAPPAHAASSAVAPPSDQPSPGKTPAGPGGEAAAQEAATSQAATDGHERAKRRARVILSDLTLYHRETLLRAARAADAKTELGTLWRDAVISYNEAIPPDLRGVTNYLEEELARHLAQLRQA